MRDDFDSGWVGAGETDDLDQRLAREENEEQFDLSQTLVMTALGPIRPDHLGLTIFGAWPMVDAPMDSSNVVHAIEDPAVAMVELDELAQVGGRSLVVAPPIHGVQDLETAHWVAARARIHLVLTEVIDAADGTLDIAPNVSRRGAASSEAFAAGLLGIALSADPTADLDLVLARLAKERQATSRPILLRGAGSRLLESFERLIGEYGVPSDSVLGWIEGDRECEVGLRSLLGQGGFGIVGIGAHEAGGESPILGLVGRLIADGFGDRIMVAAAANRADAGDSDGEPLGWADLVERLPVSLMAAGLEGPEVRRLLIDNPSQALTIDPGGRWRDVAENRR